MSESLKTISPVDGRAYVERALAGPKQIAETLARAAAAQKEWKKTALADRQKALLKAVEAFVAHKDKIAEEITWQMGRPIGQSPGEVRGRRLLNPDFLTLW